MRRMERKWRRYRLEVFRKSFLTHKVNLREAINLAKSSWLKQTIEKLEHEPRKRWKELNSEVGRKPTQSLPQHGSPGEISEKFNRFFIAKVNQIRLNLSLVSQVNSSLAVPLEVAGREPGKVYSSFQLVSESEMKRLIIKSPTKSDVKQHISVFCPLLTVLVNFALTYGMPLMFKHALVRPLLKKITSMLTPLVIIDQCLIYLSWPN